MNWNKCNQIKWMNEPWNVRTCDRWPDRWWRWGTRKRNSRKHPSRNWASWCWRGRPARPAGIWPLRRRRPSWKWSGSTAVAPIRCEFSANLHPFPNVHSIKSYVIHWTIVCFFPSNFNYFHPKNPNFEPKNHSLDNCLLFFVKTQQFGPKKPKFWPKKS